MGKFTSRIILIIVCITCIGIIFFSNNQHQIEANKSISSNDVITDALNTYLRIMANSGEDKEL